MFMAKYTMSVTLFNQNFLNIFHNANLIRISILYSEDIESINIKNYHFETLNFLPKKFKV